MWRVVVSNRTERLFEAFADDLKEPLPDPMEPEIVVVQDMGMARWLTHQLARTAGISANMRFLVPADLVWIVYGAWLGLEIQPEAWSRPVLTWHIFRYLSDFPDQEDFAELRRYVSKDPSGLKAYQLAERIAAVFDRYLVYRQDRLLSWEEGKEQGWQPVLWRRLVKTIAEPHQARLHARFLKAVDDGGPPQRPEALPRRVSLFGVNHLAPVHLEVFDRLASHLPVTLYYPNPCKEYWGDVETEKAQSRMEARTGGAVSGFGDGVNPLMASWAQSGRFFFDKLQTIHKKEEKDCFEEPAPDEPASGSLLRWVQKDILHLTDRRPKEAGHREPWTGEDRSLQVHACHSPMREVQVLHDRIAWMLEDIGDLTPQDIVVMAPDMDVYAPYVEAVFGTRDDPRIPWNLSDRRPPVEDPLLGKALEMLSLPRWRITASDVLSLLEVPAVAARFGLGPADLERVRTWVRETGIRWGLNSGHKEELGFSPDASNTWQWGLDRLFAGYALPPSELFCGEVLSYPHVEASSAECLGALQDLLDRIAFWKGILKEPHLAPRWQELLNELLDDFFLADGQWEGSLGTFRKALDRFRTFADLADMSSPLSVQVVQAHLGAFLEAAPSIRRFLSGGVTFCNLVPMRTIPFRVVCLLGLNDTDFPRMDHPPQFDLAATDPRPGDRLRNREDRFLFLEALLSARDVFYMSYVGRDIRDDSQRVPSVLVSELLDYVDACWVLPDGRPPSEEIVVHHPLQPFSRRIYDGSDSRLFSYDRQWLQGALAEEESMMPPFFPEETRLAPQESTPADEVDLDELLRFFENPSRWFLEKRLGITLFREEDPILDEEPFSVKGLDRYGMETEILQRILEGSDLEETRRVLCARGLLPQGTAGQAIFHDTLQTVQELAQAVKKQAADRLQSVAVDLPLESVRLQGRIPLVTQGGQLQFRPAKIKGKDRLRLGIRHLVLCAVRPSGIALESVHVGRNAQKGKIEVFRLKEVTNPEEHLRTLLDLWREGQRRPLPFFPDTSWEFADRFKKNKSINDALARCARTFQDDHNPWGEGFDPFVSMAFRGKDLLKAPLVDAFRKIALKVYGPILEAVHKE
ncbi:exodeoxyribonuclease V subunit gamma [Desulfacinum hydrothermale]|nr:exodeoxyribonuclease V subunit gamma [Desulfacinum hydrothermale]